MNFSTQIRFRVPLVSIMLVILTGYGVSAHAQKQMAITIDDLPIAYSRDLSLDQQKNAFRSILTALENHNVTATGFANGQRITSEWEPLLDAFVEAGHVIGNHTFSHPDLNDLPVRTYIRNIDRGEDSIQKWTGERKYFRYPFLHRGDTLAKREAVYSYLREQSYTIASVSIDNDEYLFNKQVVDAKVRGEDLDLRDSYIAHMMERTNYFEAMARTKLNRPVKHVLLLHLNYLNGLYLNALLQALRDDGWEFISLDEALKDPLYEMPDGYIGPRGLSYLERIE